MKATFYDVSCKHTKKEITIEQLCDTIQESQTKSEAAEKLGISRSTLYKLLKNNRDYITYYCFDKWITSSIESGELDLCLRRPNTQKNLSRNRETIYSELMMMSTTRMMMVESILFKKLHDRLAKKKQETQQREIASE